MKTSDNIICLTSAGPTSVMMAIKIKEWYPDCNVVNICANTSKEDKRSLIFMHECDQRYGLNLVWIEGIISPKKRVGTKYKITSFENLLRDGELFEEGIKKYGIPSRVNKWCNRELKIVPITKYANDLFGKDWCAAVGIRIDEMDRVSSSYKTNNIFYPPIDQKIDSHQRNKFWNNQPIKIALKGYEGNCDVCFEKSKRKRMTIAVENPEKLIWRDEQEKKYSTAPIEGKPQYNKMAESGGAYFGRMNESIQQLVEDSKNPFSLATDEYVYESNLLDWEDDCGASCNAFN